MTPDDWQRAMQREADAAPDPVWARETHRAARRLRLGRFLVGHLLLWQTLFVALSLLFLSPTEPGPWLTLGVLGLSFAELRRGDTARAALAAALAWGGLASVSGAGALFGMPLPAPTLLLTLTVAGLLALLYSHTGRLKMTP